jgi:tRNA-dihydrouridine synthase
MAELSHRALREVIASFGEPDEYFSEMLSAAAITQNGEFEAYYQDAGPTPERLVYQLCGVEPAYFARAARFLSERPCCGIDINMGCSAPAIVRTGAGVALMRDAVQARAIVAATRAATTRRLSVKLRLGDAEDIDALIRFCRMLENEGVELVTLHPRTSKEKFKRQAKWRYIDALRDALHIPVAGNGDIDSLACLQKKMAGNYAAIMVGRLAVKEPWIFAKARGREVKVDVLETGLRFIELLQRYQPPEFFQSRARRFFGFYCGNVKWAMYLRNKLFRETTPAGWAACLTRYFAEVGE